MGSHPATYWDVEEEQKTPCNQEQRVMHTVFSTLTAKLILAPPFAWWLTGLAVIWHVDSRLCAQPHSSFLEETVVIVGVLHVNHGSLVAFTPSADKPHHQRWWEPLSKSTGWPQHLYENIVLLSLLPMFLVVIIAEESEVLNVTEMSSVNKIWSWMWKRQSGSSLYST